jgi:hypothetical protein
MVEPLNASAIAAALSWIAADDAGSEIARCDFDGSVLGTVTLVSGAEIEVLVDVDPSPRGMTSFDALTDSDAHRAWIAKHEVELQDAWAARKERW